MPGTRKFLAVLALLVGVGTPLRAQRREFALLVGPNYSGATGPRLEATESRVGYHAGISFRIPRSSRFSMQTDLLLVEHRFYGERAPSDLSPLVVGPFSDAGELTYAQLAMQARFQRGYSSLHPVRPFLSVGPYAAVLVHCSRRLIEASGGARQTDCTATPGEASGSTAPYFPAVYQTVDFGLLGAIGVEIRRIGVSFRAERSFRNLVDPGAVPTTPFERARLWTVGLAGEFMLRVL